LRADLLVEHHLEARRNLGTEVRGLSALVGLALGGLGALGVTLGRFALGLTPFAQKEKLQQTDIDRAIIGSAKDAEKPIRPEAATGTALMRHIRGENDELREALYAATLRATPESVQETMLRVVDANEPRAAVCVVSSREKLEEANQRLGEQYFSVSDILV
jgi:Zn-dependent M16 (insulinase) family peptidase